MSFRMELRQTQVCNVCEQPRDDAKAKADGASAVLFGAARYSVCVGCTQEVPGPWGDEYKARWEEALAKKKRKVRLWRDG